MNKYFLFLFFTLYSFLSFAQTVPNGNFENWAFVPYASLDSGWFDNNPSSISLSDSLCVWPAPGVSGDAVHIQTTGIGADKVIGHIINSPFNPSTTTGGAPYGFAPDLLVGYFRTNYSGTDSGMIVVTFKAAGSEISSDTFKIGSGLDSFVFLNFSLSVASTPDSVLVAMYASASAASAINGDWMEADELAFVSSMDLPPLPNGNLDNWHPMLMNFPKKWTTYVTTPDAVQMSTDSYSGYVSLKMTANSIADTSSPNIGLISTGNVHQFGPPVGGFAYNSMIDTLTGYYKYNPQGTDTAQLRLALTKEGSVTDVFTLPLVTAADWTYFQLPFSASSVHDSARISLMASVISPASGSVLQVDFLQFKSSALPDPGLIVCDSVICPGWEVPFVDSVTGGIWSLSNGNAIIVDSAIVGILPGYDTLIYTVAGSAGTTFASKLIHIEALPVANPIVGDSIICPGTSLVLQNATFGGTWNSTNPTIISFVTVVDTPGSPVDYAILKSTAPGSSTIIYTVTNICGSAFSEINITRPDTSAPKITGPVMVCIGDLISLTTSIPGGLWAVSNTNALISGAGASGTVGGLMAGLDTVRYSLFNGCFIGSAELAIQILGLPAPGSILGSSTLCPGTSESLSDVAPGGIWTSSNSNAVLSLNVLTAVSPGTDTVSYSLTNLCGTTSVQMTVTVPNLPDAGVIVGDTLICPGSIAAFSESAGGGIWTMANSNAWISASGFVNGLTAGSDTVQYTVTTACGSSVQTFPITIGPTPNAGLLTGITSLCPGDSMSVIPTVVGGVLNTTNSLASVSGLEVYGDMSGIDTLYYVVTSICGSDTALASISILPSANAGVIVAPDTACAGVAAYVTNSTGGGIWSATLPTAWTSVDTAYFEAPGSDTIRYTVATSCGTAIATKVVSVLNIPILATIESGTGTTLCAASETTLSDSTIGGIWSVTNSSLFLSGNTITGVVPGWDTVIYSLSTYCGLATKTLPIQVLPLPVAGIIIGPDSICIGSTASFVCSSGAGTWSTTNANLWISSDGIASGLTNGSDTVIYKVTNSCGTDSAIAPVTILSKPLPSITGRSYLCVGKADTLLGEPSGGIWNTTDSLVQIVSGSEGISVSSDTSIQDTIIYTVSGFCGTVQDSLPLKIYTAFQCDSINYVPLVNNTANLISIYPNPCHGEVTVNIPEGAVDRLAVFDLSGKKLIDYAATDKSSTRFILSIHGLAPGIYILLADHAGVPIFRTRLVVDDLE